MIYGPSFKGHFHHFKGFFAHQVYPLESRHDLNDRTPALKCFGSVERSRSVSLDCLLLRHRNHYPLLTDPPNTIINTTNLGDSCIAQ